MACHLIILPNWNTTTSTDYKLEHHHLHRLQTGTPPPPQITNGNTTTSTDYKLEHHHLHRLQTGTPPPPQITNWNTTTSTDYKLEHHHLHRLQTGTPPPPQITNWNTTTSTDYKLEHHHLHRLQHAQHLTLSEQVAKRGIVRHAFGISTPHSGIGCLVLCAPLMTYIRLNKH